MAKLCLNMIVKNEEARILRCLESVAPHISCYAIYDTGSTDDTIKLIKKFFKGKKIPGRIQQGEFIDFSQARNAGLDVARDFFLDYDYILLVDADMELVVEDPHWADNLTGESYDMDQHSSNLVYLNRRLLRSDSRAKYIGVTHEYLDAASSGKVKGAHFKDHADGSNRKDKFKRDIRLLKAGLRGEPNNGRYWFYLAQSYRDAGRPQEAAKAYQKRIKLGGWDEETWNCMYNYALCLRDMGDEAGFIREMLNAYNFRPRRAESLYELAHHYRLKPDKQAVATLFAEAGMEIPQPDDHLFVSKFVYQTGLRSEFSIAGFYMPEKRDKAFRVCDALSLDTRSPAGARNEAKANLVHYLKPLKSYCPSFDGRRILLKGLNGYTELNPSIIKYGKSLKMIVRTVNYKITPEGRYDIDGKGSEITNDNPIRTENYLLDLNDDLTIDGTAREIAWPKMPPPKYGLVLGFEDMRLFAHGALLYASSTVREMNDGGWCEIVLTGLNNDGTIRNCRTIAPAHRQHEKNWMPIEGQPPSWVYNLGQVINANGEIRKTTDKLPFDVSGMRGSSQAIMFRGGYLAVIHEAKFINGNYAKRYYQHRFVWFSHDLAPLCVSLPFYLHDKQIEFVAGMAMHPDGKHLVLSYGVRDCAANVAMVEASEVAEMTIK